PRAGSPSKPPFGAPGAPASSPPFAAPRPGSPSAPPFAAPGSPSAPPFAAPGAPPFAAPGAPPSSPPFAVPPIAGPLSQPPASAPIASPGRPDSRVKPPTGAPPLPGLAPPRTKPTMPPAPFASPAIASSALGASRPSAPAIAGAPAIPAAPVLPGAPKAPSVGALADPLAATMPAPARVAPPPARAQKISVPPPRRDANPPTPTPSIITSATRPGEEPAPRKSQPTMTHTVPPMPQIDTPPPQLVRGTTQNDDSLETAMRETELITAVEIDHEAKAAYEEQKRREGLAAHEHSDVPGDDTDAIQTTARERVDADGLQDTVAAPPIQVDPDVPFKSLSAAKAATAKPAEKTPEKTAEKAAEKPSAPKVPISTAPASLPPPKSAAIPASGPTPACPQCEAPMAWVEEHLRFYCKSCRMYF
ncbi:MAG: hypothetical protein JO257_19040, partial [Deltaproteobacteria bacterium]|nr:hypothetical protein [Deltaproteobacteria bacterium]